ncbi:MAG TPA: type I DNA topoisomerase [Firmicutes bacterium]|nr:type I DNA topoisomerase [Bacillota bacterium]HWR55809.1 type I DNA topoisomerase [Negativicutes bacterium]
MAKSLVVVESPAKAKTIEKYLGKNFEVKASMGHLRDLPKSQFGVDIEQSFQPKYINIRGKGELIKLLREDAKKADKVFLATDPDREGEAIAWHLAHILGLDPEDVCRIEFNEITKNAIVNALKHPRRIDYNRVHAQQARRILDRIVGYKLSPLLWRKIRKGLSAGRVQSVAVHLICAREREIQNFISEEYWTITANLRKDQKSKEFAAQLIKRGKEKLRITKEADAKSILQQLVSVPFEVLEMRRKERKRNPAAPFITSTLQQEAARKLGFTTKKTMMLAQQLYEGLTLGKRGPVGLITYIRTDSTRVAAVAQQEARGYIESKFGKEYVPEKPPLYISKRGQDAHEAVRPTYIEYEPESVKAFLSRDQFRLYKLIWERFIASQMSPAVMDALTIDITAGEYLFRATGAQIKFPGFMVLYIEGQDDVEQDKNIVLPQLEPGQRLVLKSLVPEQHFTQPPPRYTEASLVRTLEEQGIGRPSTYAPIIDTIQARNYVLKEEKKFVPTELGFLVVDMLKDYFRDIIDVEFTAQLEDRLDSVAEGKENWVKVLQAFYGPFSQELSIADEQIEEVEIPDEVTDEICELCGRNMVIKQGRFGKFLACPGFPACRNAKPILREMGVNCPKCGGAIVERKGKKGRGRVFYGCRNYPECDFVTWDKPLQKSCPRCNSFLVEKKGRGGSQILCPVEGCGYTEDGERTNVKTKAPATLTAKGRKKKQ